VGDTISLCLQQPDYATATAVAEVIGSAIEGATAVPRDASTVTVSLPEAFRGRPTEFLAAVGQLTVAVDFPARVVVNERTGTIVVGGPVTIAPVAVAHGSLTVEVQRYYQVSQPQPLAQGETIVTPEATVEAEEEKAALVPLRAATVDDLVRALNALQATPRDLIAILHALKEAGALHAALEVL